MARRFFGLPFGTALAASLSAVRRLWPLGRTPLICRTLPFSSVWPGRRIGWRSLALRDDDGQRVDLLALLENLQPEQTGVFSLNVATKGQTFPVRLVAYAKDDAATEAERRRVRRKAQKNQRAGDPRSQLAARYMIIVTSLDERTYPATRILELYRLRWQIELAFKRLKSLLHLDRLPAKNPDLARAWLNAHLLLALIIDDITQQALDSPPCAQGHATAPDVEVATAENDDRRRHGRSS